MAQPGIKTTTWALSAPPELIPRPEHSFGGNLARAALWLLLLLFVSLFVTALAAALHPLLDLQYCSSLCIYALIGARVQHFEFLELCCTIFWLFLPFLGYFCVSLPTQGASRTVLARCANVNWIAFVLSCLPGNSISMKTQTGGDFHTLRVLFWTKGTSYCLEKDCVSSKSWCWWHLCVNEGHFLRILGLDAPGK